MKKIGAFAMQTGLFVCVFLFLLVSLFPYQALRVFTTDGPIIQAGIQYLRIIRFTYLFFTVTQILLAVLRSVETVKIALQPLRQTAQHPIRFLW